MISFNPGPTELHPLVPGAIREALASGLLSESHRGARFRAVVAGTVDHLRALLGVPIDHEVLFLGSATECMDRVLQGAVRRRSFHLVNGAFASRFHRIAEELGREAAATVVTDGEGFDLERLVVPEAVEMVCLTQNETSTGVALSPEGIRALSQRLPDALLAVDLVSGWPYTELVLEGVDAAFFSVQKGFGLPAGLGVLVASPRLLERAARLREDGRPIGSHHNLLALAAAARHSQTVATPNMLGIHLLGLVARAYLSHGLDAIRRETDLKAARIHAFLERATGWRAFVPQAGDRSRTVIVAHLDGDVDPVRRRLAAAGFLVGAGYGPWKDRHLRFANFPVHSLQAVDGLIAALEAEATSRHSISSS